MRHLSDGPVVRGCDGVLEGCTRRTVEASDEQSPSWDKNSGEFI